MTGRKPATLYPVGYFTTYYQAGLYALYVEITCHTNFSSSR
jgi:hypothetical protein